MTCQHCQTRILDDDHRCRRCGRRVRDGRGGESFPVQGAATAPAYDYETDSAPVARFDPQTDQQILFSPPKPGQLISFESLRSPSERRSIQARAAEIPRPEPLPQAKVELKRAKPKKKVAESQQRLDFLEIDHVASPPQSHIICDAPVAPAMMRAEAALIDAAIMLGPVILGLAVFLYEGGHVVVTKGTAPFWLVVLFTVPVLYKLVWSAAGRDSVGMTAMGLRLVDFDGNPPSRERRYQRAAASFISFLAAGIGLIWALVDEDSLTWHDHMSSTFPTISSNSAS
jgi:uncharacterized RDD family membrane protein YckC